MGKRIDRPSIDQSRDEESSRDIDEHGKKSATELAPAKRKSAVPLLFEQLGIQGVRTTDRFTVTYANGLLEASVKHQDGRTQMAIRSVGNRGFRQMAEFDPQSMSKIERDDLIRTLYKKGERQTALEKKFGLSQSMISNIVSKKL